jgi:hypothetical protein
MDRLIKRISTINLHSNFLSTLFFLAYLSISLVRFAWPAQPFNSFAIASIGIAHLFFFGFEMRKNESWIYLYIAFLSFFVLLSAHISGDLYRLSNNLFFILMSSGIALLLTRKTIKTWGALIPFYFLSAFFFYSIGIGKLPDEVLVCSHNGVSLMVLVGSISCYLVSDKKEIDLLPSIITLIISFWAIGRSGILASSILFSGLAFLKYKREAKPIYFFIAVISFFMTTAFLIWPILEPGGDYLKHIFANMDKPAAITNYIDKTFTPNESKSERLVIWLNYYNNLNLERFLFGSNVYTDYWPEAQLYAYNYHNSFINFHSKAGLMSFITAILIFFSSLFFAKSNSMYSLIIFVIFIRWSTDNGLFFESWDFIAYFFIFTFLKKVNLKRLFKKYFFELRFRG